MPNFWTWFNMLIEYPLTMRTVRSHLSFLYNVVRQANRDDCWGMSAEIAFILMFTLFQALILLVAVVSILGTNQEIFSSLIQFLASFLPYDLSMLIQRQIAEIAKADTGVIFTLGLFGTLWTSSSFILSLNKSFQRAYNVRETRGFWKVRNLSVILSIVGLLLMGVALSVLALGLQAARYVEYVIGYRNLIVWLIRVLRVPVAFFATAGLAALLYYAMSNVDQKFLEVLPGALFFCLIWFISTYVFGYYLKNVPQYNKTYGTLGALLMLMIWMYITSLSLLLGSELNAELHRLKVHRYHELRMAHYHSGL